MTTAANSALARLKDFKVPNWGKIPALLKREFLDAKTGFFTVPLVVSGLTLFVLIAGMISLEMRMSAEGVNLDLGAATVTVEGEVFAEGELRSEFDGATKEKVIDVVSKAFTGGTAVGLIMILPFVIFFGLLGSLYDDRKDRSYLFWKSMPVSDTREVLTKLGFYAFAGPAVLFAFMMVLSIASMIVVTPFIWAHDGSAFELLWGPAPFISMWVADLANYFVYALWILPVLAWLLLASAYAPKAPMIWAVVPVVAIIAGESIFTDQTWLGKALLDRIALDFADIMMPIFEAKRSFEGNYEVHLLTIGDAFKALGATLANTKFWIGQLFTAAFVTGAIYLRRYRV